MKIAILGLGRNCIPNEVFSCEYDGDANVIIDLIGSLKSLSVKAQLIVSSNPEPLVQVKRRVVDEIAIGNSVLRTLIGLGELDGDAVIKGVRGEAFGVSVSGKVVLFARPLLIYLVHDSEPLINELKLLLNNAPPSVSIEDVIRELASLIISERRSKKVSRTLAYLEEFLQDNDVSKLPPYILDLLTSVGAVQGDRVNRELIERIINEVKTRIYPRRG
ncbi:hypothetical protein JCM16161A_12490 [Vulcanisaeta sp. JCM 16161]|uniref:hypothetical protein n=1 Tax=Vulcanisaeta sp. JCM 16161 TaxID=1295372 RepID=UPI0006D1386F|nr:hypothetical protein [Vulcanisaeta sp. JCM 16161]